jgi:hypothetical protein
MSHFPSCYIPSLSFDQCFQMSLAIFFPKQIQVNVGIRSDLNHHKLSFNLG